MFRERGGTANKHSGYGGNENLCEVCETFQLSRQKVLKASKSAVFQRDAQKDTFSMSDVCKVYEKQKRQKNVPNEYTLNV